MPVTQHALAQDASCELHEPWLEPNQADLLLATLLAELPWESRAIRIFGREVMQPRLVCWVGDPEAVYTYSGTRHDPLPWHPALDDLRDRLSTQFGTRFNSVLCNLYRNGDDCMGMHSDREPELGPCPFIVSVSLGATRKLTFRAKNPHDLPRLDLDLSHGSLLAMGGRIQDLYRHGIPRQPRVLEPRINLTFRRIVPHQP